MRVCTECTPIPWTSHVLQGTRTPRPCIIGDPVGAEELPDVRGRPGGPGHPAGEQYSSSNPPSYLVGSFTQGVITNKPI